MNKNYSPHCRRLAMCLALMSSVLHFPAKAQWTALGNATGISNGASSYHSIVTDTSGIIYVSYHDSTLSKGSVQKYDGNNWSYVGGNAGITDSAAAYSSLAVDKTTNRLFYSFKNGTFQSPTGGKAAVREYGTATAPVNSWTGISNGEIYFNSLKIGPDGNPYLTYRDLSGTGSGIGVKRYDGSNWVNVGNALNLQFNVIGYYNSMVVANDSVYVAVQSALSTHYVLKIHAQAAAGTSWEAAGNTAWGAPQGSIFQKNLDMTADTAGDLYIAYVSSGAQGNKLNVKKYESGLWSSVGTDNFSSGTATFVSIAVTPSGTPFVAFSDGSSNARTTVMKFDGTQWVTVGTAGISTGAASHNKLTLDGFGNPIVTFADAGQGNKTIVMKYAPAVDSVDVRTQNNVPATVTANAGTLQMQAVVFPAGASQNVTWSIVPGTGAATIDASGLLTAQSNGVVYAKAVSVADPAKFDSLAVTISGQTVPVDSIDATTLNNVPAVITTNAGTLQMKATVYPASASQNVTWSITPGTGSAVISASGLVTAQGNGTVYAKAVAVSDASKSDSVLININNQLAVGTVDAGGFMTVYPSPFRDQLTIALKDAGDRETYTITLTDLSGKVLVRENLSKGKAILQPGIMPSGVYFLTVSGARGTAMVKVVRE